MLITDVRMQPIDGLGLLKRGKALNPSMAVIMITAFGLVESAVEAMKVGAFDYVTKPFKVDELLITVQRALEYRRAMSENQMLKAQLQARYGFENMVAESPSMRKICNMIEPVFIPLQILDLQVFFMPSPRGRAGKMGWRVEASGKFIAFDASYRGIDSL